MNDQVTFRIVSDLHMEGNPVPVLKNSGAEDVLVLAGDICTHKSVEKMYNLLKQVDQEFDLILWVMGNHELYRWDDPNDKSHIEFFRQTFMPHYSTLHILDDDIVNYKGVRIAGSTLWTDFDDANLITVAPRVMNDYRWGLKASTVYDWFQASYKFLKNSNADVVITHHSPLKYSVAEKFKGDYYNGLFHSNLEDLVKELRPHLWVHGHMHNSSDYIFEATRVVCNPYGYGRENLEGFDLRKVVSVPTTLR